MKIAIRIVYLFIFFPAVALNGNGLEEKWQISKTADALNFDGICDEILWDNTKILPMEMFRPNHGAKPTERSEIFVTFDDNYFYVGARLYYENGAKITVTTKKRDGADGSL